MKKALVIEQQKIVEEEVSKYVSHLTTSPKSVAVAKIFAAQLFQFHVVGFLPFFFFLHFLPFDRLLIAF